jgi:hypothetical protein
MFKTRVLAFSLACLLVLSCTPCLAGNCRAENAVIARFPGPSDQNNDTLANLNNIPYAGNASLTEVLSCQRAIDPLPSWNDGSAKTAILSFVENVTNKSNQHYVAPEERIASIDNDGTLWCEHPDYVQFLFMLDQVKDMASQHPEWNNKEPFSSILSGKRFSVDNFNAKEVMLIDITTSSNMTSDDYTSLVRNWLNTSKNPRFGLPYTKCVYKPMRELLNYLRTKGFKNIHSDWKRPGLRPGLL